MDRVNAVICHPLYLEYYHRLERAEKERIFCRHQMSHLLDVARIAYIRNLEKGYGFRKDVIYAAAVLHDIGKALQYEEKVPHEIAGERIAGEILDTLPKETGFSEEEKRTIKNAVRGHRRLRDGADTLEKLLYEADKASRLCLSCPANRECNWSEEKEKYGDKNMIIGRREFDTEHNTYIMGILNVTPDSFSDGGRFDKMNAALLHAEKMIKEGADILDVGGESTRPGHVQITDEEEIARVVPVIEKLKKEFDVPISIDTYKSAVAEAAVCAGADLVNDIWGLKYDEKMADVIAKHDVACCLMHNRNEAVYDSFLFDFMKDMKECVKIADKAGIARDKIILDPGVGFGKTYEMNLEIIQKLEIMHEFKLPILLGTSRKSVIGLTLDLPADEREEGTLVTTVYAVQKRCAFVRVHDVEKNKRAILMTQALMREHEV